MYVLSIRIDIVSAQALSSLDLNIHKEDMIAFVLPLSLPDHLETRATCGGRSEKVG